LKVRAKGSWVLVQGADFKLFPFQEDAATALRSAALGWMSHAAEEGPPKWGASVIPFLGQLRAVTGAGKTPILANVVGELGPSVILWTSRSSAVVEQTYNNLRGKYASLLPAETKVVRDIPGQAEWRALIDSKDGQTIWLLTVASWNEADSAQGSGSEEARLNLHRVHADWAGDTSPWDQLRAVARPLWIVSDESHNQSTTQLDQLADLRPKGFFMASATPVQNERFAKWSEALTTDETWKALAHAGIVRVRTKDVVEAELLKTTINVIDFNSGTEESLDGALAAFRELEEAVASEGSAINPRAIYVVERSNPVKGSPDPSRPVAIWQHLVANGVPMDEIAVYTDTKVLPEGAEKVASLSGLHPRYRHIIFNQTLQEGWDDPEAYVCYFDGVTKSYTRIKQIVGRVLRQPMSRHSGQEVLNTATLIVNVPAASYDTVLAELKAEMRLYAPEDDPDIPTIKVKTRKDPLAAIPLKPGLADKLTLPNRALKAPNMTAAVKIIKGAAREWTNSADLDAPGRGRLTVLSLAKEEQEREEYLDVVRSARTNNGVFLRRYIQQRNRACLHAIHPDVFKGEGFSQFSCLGSTAQTVLRTAGDGVVEHYEAGVEYEADPDPDSATWTLGPHQPKGREMAKYRHAAHAEYATADMNALERQFALALDAVGKGVWVRNPATPSVGFSIPLPAKVGESSRFYPDFLWWLDDGTCWAIDPTGQHLLQEKVRGKLVALDNPRVALVAEGHVELPSGARSDAEGWSLVHARAALPASVQTFETLPELLDSLTQ
jgi:type III restriction enzyme